MNVAYEAFYLIRWLIYLVRLVLNFAYGVLAFVAKPGSRWIVPVLAGGAGYYFLAPVERAVTAFALSVDTRALPDFAVNSASAAQLELANALIGHQVEPWMLHTGMVALFLLGWLAYVLLSRALAVVIGAFPKVTRPLIPLRRLRATNVKIKSAVVQIAVPKLRF